MAGNGDIRKELINTGRLIVKAGLAISTGGNISGREGRYIYIKTKGSRLDSADRKGYARIDLASGRCRGGVPSSEKYIHLACYKKRDDIKAVLHLHPVFSTAVANSRVKLGPVSYELLSCLGSELARAAYRPAGSKALAKEVARLIGRHNGILLPNHGFIIVAGSLEEAFLRAMACERACQTIIFSKLLGLYAFLPRKEAKRIISIYSSYI